MLELGRSTQILRYESIFIQQGIFLILLNIQVIENIYYHSVDRRKKSGRRKWVKLLNLERNRQYKYTAMKKAVRKSLSLVTGLNRAWKTGHPLASNIFLNESAINFRVTAYFIVRFFIERFHGSLRTHRYFPCEKRWCIKLFVGWATMTWKSLAMINYPLNKRVWPEYLKYIKPLNFTNIFPSKW